MKKYKIIRKLNIKNKNGTWIQIEMLTGKEKGLRRPITLEELKK